jgi:hypothetical protein
MTGPWQQVSGPLLQQGDWLVGCPVPIFGAEYASAAPNERGDVSLAPTDILVVTQSCDLEARHGKPPKARLVAVCPIYSLDSWVRSNDSFRDAKLKEKARRGEVEGVHLVASPQEPTNNNRVLVAYFREIYSLPYPFISAHAAGASNRWRLRSPYLEHFSQAFARFFMRVGLPSDIPSYLPAKT